ncbi:TIGR02450 family Trp-rich protein [Pseudomonas sp. nanlin1]|uniref:TIGR02450 family Trp-rich protein n=1 Tax=Pseudomonas sp. nanlin1 TaxID=3040605 RepID=UPI00388FDDEE
MSAAGHRLNPRKLLLSKWTATRPLNREKHFLVTQLVTDEDGTVLEVELQAVLNQRVQRLPWQALRDADSWLMGWK